MANEIQAQLQSLILEPREELNIEIKTWLDLSDQNDKAKLAKALMALANYGGGYLIIGFDQLPDGTFSASPSRPENLNMYGQDLINGIIKSYADPAFHCSVHFVKPPTGGDLFPIVIVPGGHKTPIQCKRASPDQKILIQGKYYVRQSGPESAEPKGADVWREMIAKCVRAGRDDLLDAIREVLSGGTTATEAHKPDHLKKWISDGEEKWKSLVTNNNENGSSDFPGGYRIAYEVMDETSKPSLGNLLQIVDRSTIRHTGWSPFWVPTKTDIAPKPHDGFIECFLGEAYGSYRNDPAHSDFWRVSSDGLAIIIRGFDEDGYPERFPQKAVLDITLPVWRIGETMLQAAQFAKNLGVPNSDIKFSVKWFGLNGRRLISWNGERHLSGGYVAAIEEYENTITFNTEKLSDNQPEILFSLLENLYGFFNFFPLSKSLVIEELKKMKSNRF